MRNGYPSRAQAIRRRIVAVVVLFAALAVGIWAAAAGLRGNEDTPPAPTTTAAPPKIHKLVFPEGFTRRDMAARVETSSPITAAAYLKATEKSALPAEFGGKGTSFEGFLFPATYEIFETDKADRIVRDQVAAFRRNWGQVNLAFARTKNLTPYDVLIIASMIEKEVVVQRERALVSAVIYNRLRGRIPLGIDATIRYGLDIPADKPILQSHLESDSPYNSRRFQGLPPTPIANPGLASMKAAARPADVDYLYFVRKPDCKTHFFTNSIDEFNNYTREGLNKTCG